MNKNEYRWKEVWNNRSIDHEKLHDIDEFDLYCELKRLDGFDVEVKDSDGYYKGFYNGINEIYEKYIKSNASVYEVGCGSGANLMFLKNRGLKIGGVDYSSKLVDAVNDILPNEDITLAEASDMDVSEKYDVVMSDSVFAYFSSVEYAKDVLEKMYMKAGKRIVLLEIFDKDFEEECNAYRRSQVENYDELYNGLDKIFYPRKMFTDFAEDYDCDIEFTDVKNEFYWNSKYMYNCIITKR